MLIRLLAVFLCLKQETFRAVVFPFWIFLSIFFWIIYKNYALFANNIRFRFKMTSCRQIGSAAVGNANDPILANVLRQWLKLKWVTCVIPYYFMRPICWWYSYLYDTATFQTVVNYFNFIRLHLSVPFEEKNNRLNSLDIKIMKILVRTPHRNLRVAGTVCISQCHRSKAPWEPPAIELVMSVQQVRPKRRRDSIEKFCDEMVIRRSLLDPVSKIDAELIVSSQHRKIWCFLRCNWKKETRVCFG